MRALQGHRYRARIVIGWPKRLVATWADVRDELLKKGLSDVNVEPLGGGVFDAEGSWKEPDTDAFDLPDTVKSVEDLGLTT